MKFFVKIVLILFIAFLATPSVVSMIEKRADKSCFYDIAEEDKTDESNLSIKEYTADYIFQTYYHHIHFPAEQSGLIHSEKLSMHDNAPPSIIIPPPEQV